MTDTHEHALSDQVAAYYAAQAAQYDESAGYTDPDAESTRAPMKERYRGMFTARHVLEVACGSGYWTSVISEVASSMTAVDINPPLLDQAKARCNELANLELLVDDAYALMRVDGGFDAAFAALWWSHIPRERLDRFLQNLHKHLSPGALVCFTDQLPYTRDVQREDDQGNTLERRTLDDGRQFDIVKNFPSRTEIVDLLKNCIADISYTECPEEKSWTLIYRLDPHYRPK